VGCQSEFGTCSPTPSSTKPTSSPSSATAASATTSTVQTTPFKAGVATASTIALLALLSLAIFILLRRRRRNHKNNSYPHKTTADDAVEAPSDSGALTAIRNNSNVNVKVYPSELSATTGYHQELPANEKNRGPRIEEREIGH
jgi:MYXO-CTERM domain-containing protein